ncbi:MAG: DUF389 domain-containing protein [Candidatus Paceibacterota bacterium]|jgi:uncharacterized hydrophobic protein (TIGR00271 family)
MLKSSIFNTSYLDQQQILKELMNNSRESSDFYFLLFLSATISSLALLLDSVAVLIGGMLVAPLIFPLVSLSLGIVTSSRLAVWRSLKILGRSILIVVFTSALVAFLFGLSIENNLTLLQNVHPNLLYFLVAFAAGTAVSYSWIKKGLSMILPGVAVTVALVPPLASVGVALAFFDFPILGNSLAMFFINFLGIVLAGIVIFSVYGFSRLQKEEEAKIEEQDLEKIVREGAIQEAEQKKIKSNNLSF